VDFVLLSDTAMDLAKELRSHVGSDKAGIGPGVDQLVKLWGARDAARLRPAMDELEAIGFLKIDRRLGAPQLGIDAHFSVQDVAGVQVADALQDYLDNFD
jgi:hypothetical protein